MNNTIPGKMKTKEEIDDYDRRREALRLMIQANGGNTSEYAIKVGLKPSTVFSMLRGTSRVSDRALGIPLGEDVRGGLTTPPVPDL